MVRPVRFHARFNCDIPVEIHSSAHKRKLVDARIVNLSMGGLAVSCGMALQRAVAYEFRFDFEEHKLRLTGRVAWEKPPAAAEPKLRRYGISCTLSVKQEMVLKVVVDRLRTQQWPTGDERLKNYWSL